jgi:26S proteasome regulatory subunit N9
LCLAPFPPIALVRARRLWHQLTDALFAFAADPASAPARVDVYTRFVRDFEARLNPLRLVELAVLVAKELDSACPLLLPSFVAADAVQTRSGT